MWERRLIDLWTLTVTAAVIGPASGVRVLGSWLEM